ncbi:transposase [Thermus sediminis]|uniref:transposase n=1 Tax=Thermus sediminis TaxID=1761908 RepID=UPI001E55DFDD|nr:transposase [Thermus sediminis]
MSRGILAAGSARVSEMVATLPSHLQRPFHQAEALYRFLANPRVGAEALLERVCRESALALEGEEVLVFLDLSPVRKPHARALEGIARVGRKRETGYELLTALGMDVQGRLVGYAHLVAYGERGFASLPREVERAIAGARGVLGGRGGGWCTWRTGVLTTGRCLGRCWGVELGLGWREVEGRRLHLVVSWIPALGRRGEWWLLTSLEVRGEREALRVVEMYRRRWGVEEFFRLLRAGLGLESFQVRGLSRIRKVVAVLLGLAVFLWEVRRSGGVLEGLLLRLGGKLGIASERDGPYLLLRGLVRLLNYEVTKEALEEEEGSFG